MSLTSCFVTESLPQCTLHAVLTSDTHVLHNELIMQSIHLKGSSLPAPATFVDISAVRANFCMKFYATVKQDNGHFITNFCNDLEKNTPPQKWQYLRTAG